MLLWEDFLSLVICIKFSIKRVLFSIKRVLSIAILKLPKRAERLYGNIVNFKVKPKYIFLMFGFLSIFLGIFRYRFEAIIFGLIMLGIAAFEAH
jgi:hypothetical protein